MYEDIESYWRELAAIALNMPVETMTAAGDVLLECHRRGSTVFVLGNGGSAATASHFACDLAKGTQAPGIAAFRVIPVTDNVPLLTAWANDTSYEQVFAEQLKTLLRPGDVVFAISASGNSPNVLHALEVAHALEGITIGVAGETGGALAGLADVVIRVPGGSIEQVEDAHLAVCHSLCVALRKQLAGLSERLWPEAPLAEPVEAAPVVLELGNEARPRRKRQLSR